jgi:hypothetical protein
LALRRNVRAGCRHYADDHDHHDDRATCHDDDDYNSDLDHVIDNHDHVIDDDDHRPDIDYDLINHNDLINHSVIHHHNESAGHHDDALLGDCVNQCILVNHRPNDDVHHHPGATRRNVSTDRRKIERQRSDR